AAEISRRVAARFSSRHGLELQQHGIRGARNSDSQSERRILRRLFASADFRAAGNENAHHQRERHHSQSLGGIQTGARPVEKSGLGFAFAEYYRGWQLVFHYGRSREMGRGALHHETAQAIFARRNVDDSKISSRAERG